MNDSITTQVQIGSTIYTCNTPYIYGIAYNRKKAWDILQQAVTPKPKPKPKPNSVRIRKTTHTRGNT